MSHWNYRVVHDEDGYFVTDVYYDDAGQPHSWGERHFFLDGDTKDDLGFEVSAVTEAWAKPTLEVVDGDKLVETNA